MSPLMAFKKGGVHPADRKELSAQAEITPLAAPKTMIVPLAQHIGAPTKAVVKKGDEVLVGQVLAEPGGFVSTVIHSPVSGKVKKIADVVTAGGERTPAIEIINDGEDNWIEEVNLDGGRSASR